MSFAERICDYLFENRLYQFQNNFYELYKEYKVLGEEEFIKKWFDNFLIKSLYKYFSCSYILELFDIYITTKRVVLKSYVNTYWKYCDNPRLFQGKIKEALDFFGMENLSLKELQIKYRKLVKECHPDKALNKKEAHSKMITINYYYQILRSYLGE